MSTDVRGCGSASMGCQGITCCLEGEVVWPRSENSSEGRSAMDGTTVCVDWYELRSNRLRSLSSEVLTGGCSSCPRGMAFSGTCGKPPLAVTPVGCNWWLIIAGGRYPKQRAY